MAQFGFGPASPAMDLMPGAAMAAPQPQQVPPSVPAQAAQQVQAPYKPSIWDIAQGMLFDGSSPAEAAMAARSRHVAVQQNEFLQSALQQMSPADRLAILLNGPEAGKALADRLATHTVAGGSTLVNGGPGGAPFTAPMLGFDAPSGRGYTQTVGATTPTGPSLGGGFDLKDGVVNNTRTGPNGQTYSTPQILPSSSTGKPFTPSLGGPMGGAPAQGAQPSAGVTPAQNGNAPRGVRNRNFGNVKALPNGQIWQGQVGVDDQGHVIFDTEENGIRAAQKNLEAYQTKHGINTVQGVVDRWANGAPDKVRSAYTAYLSGALHVDPGQQIDLTDPKVQQPLLKGIFGFENGPQTMSAWRRPKAGAGPSASDAAPAGQSAGFGEAFAQGKEPRPMTAQERQAWHIPTNDPRPYMVGPDGKPSAISEASYGPKDVASQRDTFFKSPEFSDYANSVNAANAIEAQFKTFGKNNSVLDQAAVDNSIRAMTGLSAKQGSVTNFMEHLGLPDQLQGKISRVVGDGYVTPQVLLQMRDMIRAYADGHRSLAEYRLNNESEFAKRQGQELGITLPDMQPKAESPAFNGGGSTQLPAGIPPATQRKPGLYNTPRGPAQWDGQHWHLQGAH